MWTEFWLEKQLKSGVVFWSETYYYSHYWRIRCSSSFLVEKLNWYVWLLRKTDGRRISSMWTEFWPELSIRSRVLIVIDYWNWLILDLFFQTGLPFHQYIAVIDCVLPFACRNYSADVTSCAFIGQVCPLYHDSRYIQVIMKAIIYFN